MHTFCSYEHYFRCFGLTLKSTIMWCSQRFRSNIYFIYTQYSLKKQKENSCKDYSISWNFKNLILIKQNFENDCQYDIHNTRRQVYIRFNDNITKTGQNWIVNYLTPFSVDIRWYILTYFVAFHIMRKKTASLIQLYCNIFIGPKIYQRFLW